MRARRSIDVAYTAKLIESHVKLHAHSAQFVLQSSASRPIGEVLDAGDGECTYGRVCNSRLNTYSKAKERVCKTSFGHALPGAQELIQNLDRSYIKPEVVAKRLRHGNDPSDVSSVAALPASSTGPSSASNSVQVGLLVVHIKAKNFLDNHDNCSLSNEAASPALLPTSQTEDRVDTSSFKLGIQRSMLLPEDANDFDVFSEGVPIPKDVMSSDHQSLESSCPGTKTPRSPLLRLPADIRNIIYHFAFSDTHGIHLRFDGNPPCGRRSSIISNPTPTNALFSLAYTCKEIYNETCNFPFWLNTTHFHAPVLQDPWALRNATLFAQPKSYLPTTTTLPDLQPVSRRRVIEAPQQSLTTKCPVLRQKAHEYITLAMRLPHLDHVVSRLNCTAFDRTRVERLNRVHVHLGSQTNNVFVERFFTAWSQVLPSLLSLAESTNDLRISFALRTSRRMVIDFEFGVSAGGTKCLAEMDGCVVVPYAGDLTLPELAIINGVRSRVWRGFFGANQNGKPPTNFNRARKACLPNSSGLATIGNTSGLTMIAASVGQP